MKLNLRAQKLVRKLVTTTFSKDGNLSESKVKEYLKMITSLKSSRLIFLKAYLKILKSEVLKRTLILESSTVLNQVEQTKISQVFAKKFQVTTVLNQINPSLLGGIRVKIGDMLFDNTVAGKINKIGESIRG
ncbi:MAG: F0F1 ATP synthase subunit delta [Candidatus Daviesbacteria bacterium]|nr:F0F1 ATP synthase subunit delta [Candidatus Daviesbacteria bacterium]